MQYNITHCRLIRPIRQRQYHKTQWHRIQYNTPEMKYNARQCNTMPDKVIQNQTKQWHTTEYHTPPNTAPKCNAIPDNVTQYQTMQYNIRRCRPIRQLKYQTRQCNTGQYNAILDKTKPATEHSITYRTIRCNIRQDNRPTTQHSIRPFNKIQTIYYNTRQYNAGQYKTIPGKTIGLKYHTRQCTTMECNAM